MVNDPVIDIYISADIEADGPIPGRYSMLAFGFSVAATFDGNKFQAREPTAATFYRELRPISEEFDAVGAGGRWPRPEVADT